MSFELKPHQIRCIEAYEDLRSSGKKFRRCITSVTGSGKSLVMTEIARREVARGGRVVLYSIRRLLTEQFIKQLQRDGIPFGCRAAEFDEHIDDDAPVQICSMQTEQARVIKKRLKNRFEGEIGRRQFPLSRASLVVLDECVSGDTLVITENGTQKIKDCKDAKYIVTQENGVDTIKSVARWIPRGERETLTITLENGVSLKCTPEHRLMTSLGWMEARMLGPGSLVQISVNVAADCGLDLGTGRGKTISTDTSKGRFPSGERFTKMPCLGRQNVNAGAEGLRRFSIAATTLRTLLSVAGLLNTTGLLLGTKRGIKTGESSCLSRKDRQFSELFSETRAYYCQTRSQLPQGLTQTTVTSKRTGSFINATSCQGSARHGGKLKILGMETVGVVGKRLACRALGNCLKSSTRMGLGRRCLVNGLMESEKSGLRGGFAMTDQRLAGKMLPVRLRQMDFHTESTKLSRSGLQKTTAESRSTKISVDAGTSCMSRRMRHPRFTVDAKNMCQNLCDTSFVAVKSVTDSGIDEVFDFEVEGTHSFYANGILVHNCHLLGGQVAREIVDEHVDLGASVLGFSATPFGCGDLFDDGGLIFGADVSEGRKSGLLVPAYIKGCPEMDTRQIEKVKTASGDWSEAEIRKHCWTQAIYGYVMESLVEHNPALKPFFLFAPGVEESVGFESHFRKNGIRTAHIDATDVVLDGKRYPSNRDVRSSILKEHESGAIKGICNRWVLREAVDAPWVENLILATPFGSLTTYLQICGRGLRASPSTGKKHLIINDHGGNYWRFGSPNADRHDLIAEFFDDPDGNRIASETRLEDIRQEKEDCPVSCPRCGSVQILMKTGKCYNCEHDMRGKQQRFVIQRDGKLIELTGLPVKPRREVRTQDMVRAWTSAYWAAKRPGSKLYGNTFAQLRGMIASGHFRGFEKLRGQWPAAGLPFTPKDSTSWFRSVSDVPSMNLHGNG